MGFDLVKSLKIRLLSSLRKFRLLAFLAFVVIGAISPAILFAGDNTPCLECHTNPEKLKEKLKTTEKAKINPITGEIKVVSLLLDEPTYKASAHGGEDFFCIDCHQDLDGVDLSEGHKSFLKPVDCITFCHDDPAEEYLESRHVKLMQEKSKDVPTCKDCHFSLTYHLSPLGDKTPMDVPRADDPAHRGLIIETCGSCHQDYLDSYRNNAHGQVAALGHTTTDIPVCSDCHGQHTILNSSEPESKVGQENILETCGNCHADANASFVKHIEHPQIKNIKYYKTLLHALKNARNDPENFKKVLKNPQTILCIVFLAYMGILGFTFSSFGLHSLLTWFATVRDERRRKGHADEEQH